MYIYKIRTRKGNFFVFQTSKKLGIAEGRGFYVKPNGEVRGERFSASTEVEWVFGNYKPEPVIEEASVEEYGHLFSGNTMEVIGCNKKHTQNPFSELSEKIQFQEQREWMMSRLSKK